MTREVEVRRYRADDLDAVVALCGAEGWTSYSSPPEVARALGGPGVIAACADVEGRVVGFGYAQTDGVIQAHLSLLTVAAPYRRRGVGRALVQALLVWSGARRIDLVTDDAVGFYRSLPHRALSGFRIYDADA